MDSLANYLATKGYLTANGLCKYLHEYHPDRAVSYPTLKRLVDAGKIQATRVGGQVRISKTEIDRFVREGNLDPNRQREEGVEPSSTPITKSVLRLGDSMDSGTSTDTFYDPLQDMPPEPISKVVDDGDDVYDDIDDPYNDIEDE